MAGEVLIIPSPPAIEQPLEAPVPPVPELALNGYQTSLECSAGSSPSTSRTVSGKAVSRTPSLRSSIFRRSEGGDSELTTEEAILTTVFSGHLSPTIAETLLDNEEMEVVPVYDAIAVYDYDAEGDGEVKDPMTFRSGDRIRVFGKQDIRNTVLGSGDFGGGGEDWAWEKEVEVSDGWCQVEIGGIVGFAPVSYLRFASDTTPLETRSEIELVLTDSRPPLTRFPALPTPAPLNMVDSFLSGNGEVSLTGTSDSSISQLNYPSAMAAIGHGVGAITGKVRNRLRRLLGSWFDGDSVHDFILGKAAGSNPVGEAAVESEGDEDTSGAAESGKHMIESGFKWSLNSPAYDITLQVAERRRKVSLDDAYIRPNTITDEFISYKLLSWFPDEIGSLQTVLTVHRRFNDFEWLHGHLQNRFPPSVIPLPALPSKQHMLLPTRRFDRNHVALRMRALERYLNALARHPLLRSEEVVVLFLSCGGTSVRSVAKDDRARSAIDLGEAGASVVVDDEEWIDAKRVYDIESAGRNPGPANFYKRIALTEDVHPETGFPNMMDRFAKHLSLFEAHLDPLVESTQKHQTTVVNLHNRYQEMAECLEVLARGQSQEGRMLRNLAWCWKRGCYDCHEFSNALLAVSKHLQGVAIAYEQHAQEDLTIFNERVREYATTVSGFQALSQLNDVAESRAEELRTTTSDPTTTATLVEFPDPQRQPPASTEAMQKRLSTILSVGQAEVERLHTEKVAAWDLAIKGWMDEEIATQEKVLNHLYAARAALGRS
ncbi:hypothetical protein HKX48_000452 [Thoreauomyces humboldtii]|nr:hypothetical protein HKX48_000452 [Thoreauomyces humboldtii]